MARVAKRTWKNKDGTTCQSWQIVYNDFSGKEKKESGFRTKAEAESALANALNKAQADTNSTVNKDITFAEASDLHIKLYAEVHLKKSTCDGYKGYLKYHLLPVFGKMKIVDITKTAIEELVKSKIQEGKSNQTINHLINLMSAILQRMVEDDIISKNQARRVRKMEIKSKEVRILESAEMDVVLDVAKKFYPEFYPLLFTAILTGLRRGELMGLKWSKINWITNQINVDASFHKGMLTTPKTKHSVRKVKMCQELAKVLKEWKLKCPKGDKDLVFPNESGNFQDADNMVKRKFEPIIRKAGIDKVTWKSLRHTFVSILISQNVNPKYIQKQVGHGSYKVTMDIYGHIMSENYEQGVEALDNFLNRELTSSKLVDITHNVQINKKNKQ